ncbi:MAG: hypothetical protein QM680_13455 [Luteolibacter sp.]
MGTIHHDAIVITSSDEKELNAARNKAATLGLDCSEIVQSKANGYQSFFIAPDGSKEGWESSNKGDEIREAWIRWARERNRVDWAHIRFGGDNYEMSELSDHSGRFIDDY